MSRDVLLYPLGEIKEYEEITYVYNSKRYKTKLPVLWLAEEIGNIKHIAFIITTKTEKDYYPLFEKLCESLLAKNIEEIFTSEEIRQFKRKDNFKKDQEVFVNKINAVNNNKFEYEFITINENDLVSFIKDLKTFLQKHEDTTLHIDITHAYRFIPMFITIVVSLLKNSGINIKIGEILYAFGTADENKIISLKDYFNVLGWSHGIYSFKTSANIIPIAENLKKYHIDISNVMNTLQSALDMNLASEIKKSLTELNERFQANIDGDEVFKELVLDEIKSLLSEFNLAGSQSDFELSLAKWHLENKRYLHGYTALIEAMITKLCEEYGFETNKREYREQAKCICLSIRSENLKKYPDYKAFVDTEIKKDETLGNLQKNLSLLFDELTIIRNSFAHIKTLDESESQRIYKKSTDFALSQNPSVLNTNITLSNLAELFNKLAELPTLFSKEKLEELSGLYKNMQKGG